MIYCYDVINYCFVEYFIVCLFMLNIFLLLENFVFFMFFIKVVFYILFRFYLNYYCFFLKKYIVIFEENEYVFGNFVK